MVAGVLPALLVLAFALKVGIMVQDNSSGRDAFDRGDYDGAAADFFDTRSLNWLERWVAPFDEGSSHHAEGLYDEAIAAYEASLDVVPERDECTVRINLALAHEAVGDGQQERQDTEGALESWQAGIDVLAAGECPTDSGRGQAQSDDAAAVDERLRSKIEQNEQQEQPPEQPPEQPQDPGEQDGDEQDPRRERLERNNERGQDRRGGEQDLYEDQDYTRPESW
jgi:tetratricopeptide (TPR) repeat protein